MSRKRCVWPTPEPVWEILSDLADLQDYEDQFKPDWYVGGRYSKEDWKEFTKLAMCWSLSLPKQ